MPDAPVRDSTTSGADHSHPSGPHRQVFQAILNHFQDDRLPCLQFRHHDDDAIAVDYVAKWQQTAEDCGTYLAQHRRLTVDFNNGFIGQPDAKGFQAKSIFKQLWVVTLAMTMVPWMRQTVMNFQHNKMAQFMSRVTQNDSDMFVRCHCDFNCSYENDVDQAPHHDHLAVARKALFQQWTAIDRNGVRQNFGYLHDIFASWYKV